MWSNVCDIKQHIVYNSGSKLRLTQQRFGYNYQLQLRLKFFEHQKRNMPGVVRRGPQRPSKSSAQTAPSEEECSTRNQIIDRSYPKYRERSTTITPSTSTWDRYLLQECGASRAAPPNTIRWGNQTKGAGLNPALRADGRSFLVSAEAAASNLPQQQQRRLHQLR